MLPDAVEITIRVPAALADAGAADRARLLLVLDAVRSERMTYRAAARVLDVAPYRLLDLAREHGVPVTRYDTQDLAVDLSTLDKLARLRATNG